jgi:hypothetical protein
MVYDSVSSTWNLTDSLGLYETIPQGFMLRDRCLYFTYNCKRNQDSYLQNSDA